MDDISRIIEESEIISDMRKNGVDVLNMKRTKLADIADRAAGEALEAFYQKYGRRFGEYDEVQSEVEPGT
jgi:hypothetical protein